MTKDVLVSITGIQTEIVPEKNRKPMTTEPMETITPALYYKKNNKHYIIYDEPVEGTKEVIKNKIKITDNKVIEIMKSGVSNSHMTFEKNKKNRSVYQTPYGEMVLDVDTEEMEIIEGENRMLITLGYQLDVNDEPLAKCHITMNITSKASAKL